MPVAEPTPEVTAGDLTEPAKQAALVITAGVPSACPRYFLAPRGFLVWIPNGLSCAGNTVMPPLGEGPDHVAYVDSAGAVLGVEEFHGLEGEICPSTTIGLDGSIEAESCPAWEERVETSNGSDTDMGPEDSLRRLRGPDGRPMTRRALRAAFREARFGRGRDYCQVAFRGESTPRPFECGWLWVGLVAGLPHDDPLPDLLRRVQGINAGHLSSGGMDGIRVRVQVGEVKAAALSLLSDNRVRFVELAWAGLELW